MSPGMGRFITPDPYRSNSGGPGNPSDPGSWNRYAHTLDDPINYNDPRGMEAACPPDTACYSTTGSDYPDDGGSGVTGGGGPQNPWNDPGGNGQKPLPAGPAQAGGGGRGPGVGDFVTAALSMIDAGILLRTALLSGISPACQNDLAAVQVTADQIIAAAGSLAGNIYDGWGSSVNYASEIYANSPAQNANAGPLTIGQYFANNPGTVAIAQVPGNAIFIDPTWVNSFNAGQVEALVFHELIHNITGNVDSVIQGQLGVPQVPQSVNISNKLQQDCIN